MLDYVLVGGNICLEHEIITDSALIIKKGIIDSICSEDTINLKKYSNIIHLSHDNFIIPGFIDVHIHGANGSDVMDASLDGLKNISHSILKNGTTGFLATTMSEREERISNALTSVNRFMNSPFSKEVDYSDIYGIHLEGPYLSELKAGAQNPKYVKSSDIKQFDRWNELSGNMIKKVTVAPESDVDLTLISHLNRKKINSSIGHTCCSSKDAWKVINAGVSSCTHMFNAMSGFDHRNPGALLPVLMSDQIIAELIADEVHTSPEILDFAYRIKGANHIILVTDAMSAQGYGDGVFKLGGQSVIVKGNEARLENGTLAGSVLSMNKALVNMLKNTNCSLLEVIKMTSSNPANQIGVYDKVGSISLGKKANLVVLDKNFQILDVHKSGIKI